ncbi:MAG: hypothetical protein U9O89_04045 [Thermoproteota archaeon]|nr:hypothetical protein [Thermoproteota archaeon]
MENKRKSTGRIKHNPTGKMFDEVSYLANNGTCHYKMQPKLESLGEGEIVFGGHFIDGKLNHADILRKNYGKLKKVGRIKDKKILLSHVCVFHQETE